MAKCEKSDHSSIIGAPVVVQIFKDYPNSAEKHDPIEGVIKKEVHVNGLRYFVIESSNPEVYPPTFMVTEVAKGDVSISEKFSIGSEEVFVAIAPVSDELIERNAIDDYQIETLAWGEIRLLEKRRGV